MDENDCARYVDEVSNCQDKNELQVFASLKSVAFEEFGQKEENEVFSSDNPESCFQSYRSEDMRSEDDVLQSVRNEQLKLGSTTDSEGKDVNIGLHHVFITETLLLCLPFPFLEEKAATKRLTRLTLQNSSKEKLHLILNRL